MGSLPAPSLKIPHANGSEGPRVSPSLHPAQLCTSITSEQGLTANTRGAAPLHGTRDQPSPPRVLLNPINRELSGKAQLYCPCQRASPQPAQSRERSGAGELSYSPHPSGCISGKRHVRE